jgi:dolichyl-phosphate-mannose--protein O-mannosyl transferase
MAVAGFLMFYRLGAVQAPIWDEAYYLTATARYHEHRAQFASHPPLGLMLIAAGDSVSGRNRGIDQTGLAAVKSIRAEQVPSGYDYTGPRLASALFGTLGAGLFFWLMFDLAGSVGAALMLAPLWLLDTALITQFRAAQLDSFQLVFVLIALICTARASRSRAGIWFLGIGLASGLAALVRANGVLIGVPGAAIVLYQLWRREWLGALRNASLALAGGSAALMLVLAAYVATTTRLPDRATPAGRIDDAHLSTAHRLAIASGNWSPAALAAVVTDNAAFIGADLAGVPHDDANGSHPLGWMVGKGTITYQWRRQADRIVIVALIANAAVWLVSLMGVAWTFAALMRPGQALAHALLVGWAASMVLLIDLDQQRVLYLYHYFIPLLIGHAQAALAWRGARLNERYAWPALAAVSVTFVVLEPFALHQELTVRHCQMVRRLVALSCGEPLVLGSALRKQGSRLAIAGVRPGEAGYEISPS